MTDKDIANAKPTSKRPTVNRRSLLKKITIGVLTVKADMGFFALSAYSQQIGRPVRAIDLQGRHPGVPAITPDWKYAVSVNQESHNLSLVSLSNLQLDKTIDLTAKREPWKVTLRADAPIGFVTHSSFETSHDDNSVVTAVDYAQGRELAQIPVGKRPNGVAVDRTNSLVFVTNKGSATVSVIDARTFQVIKTIPVGNKPNDVELTPDNKFALVVDYEDATVSFIDVAGLLVVDTVRTVARTVRSLPDMGRRRQRPDRGPSGHRRGLRLELPKRRYRGDRYRPAQGPDASPVHPISVFRISIEADAEHADRRQRRDRQMGVVGTQPDRRDSSIGLERPDQRRTEGPT